MSYSDVAWFEQRIREIQAEMERLKDDLDRDRAALREEEAKEEPDKHKISKLDKSIRDIERRLENETSDLQTQRRLLEEEKNKEKNVDRDWDDMVF